MRNIKYKAWIKNPDINKYILQDVLRLDFFLDTKTLAKVHTKSFRQHNPFEVAFDSYDPNKVELLEFTEYYDMDGNEIYTGVVEWDKDATSYVLRVKDHYNEYFNEVDNIKILGNIYENKELINETTEV